jgi:hypothetical protein
LGEIVSSVDLAGGFETRATPADATASGARYVPGGSLQRALAVAAYVALLLGVVVAAGWFLETWRPDLVAAAWELIRG